MINQLLQNYNNYKEQNLIELTIKYADIERVVSKLNADFFEITVLGKSFEDRNIYQIKVGEGKTKILLWSQMHGNEAVGTMAIFDILNFFVADDELNSYRQKLLKNCTFYFVPMLNPDGAEKKTRRNAQSIDLNRDALKLTAPESIILNEIADEIMPEFGFNLHDQEIYYGPENSNKTSALSFLAPAFDYPKTINEKRTKSMLVIADIFRMLQNYIPNQVAKYNDSFMPNAFGDNIQKKGISTILVEAGYILGNEHRQEVRKYYFLSLVYAFYSIVEQNFKKFVLKDYNDIPMNVKLKFCDYIFKNVTIKQNNKEFTTDISVIRNILDSEKFTDYEDDFIIWDIGDMQNKFAFEIIDLKWKKIENGNNIVERLKKADFLFKYR
ncbi:MAG: hypothetical protein JXL97_04725 [Bacteroidales bacterium]|nr:hypothetical protein [Bacteroidales bacterium]